MASLVCWVLGLGVSEYMAGLERWVLGQEIDGMHRDKGDGSCGGAGGWQGAGIQEHRMGRVG